MIDVRDSQKAAQHMRTASVAEVRPHMMQSPIKSHVQQWQDMRQDSVQAALPPLCSCVAPAENSSSSVRVMRSLTMHMGSPWTRTLARSHVSMKPTWVGRQAQWDDGPIEGLRQATNDSEQLGECLSCNIELKADPEQDVAELERRKNSYVPPIVTLLILVPVILGVFCGQEPNWTRKTCAAAQSTPEDTTKHCRQVVLTDQDKDLGMEFEQCDGNDVRVKDVRDGVAKDRGIKVGDSLVTINGMKATREGAQQELCRRPLKLCFDARVKTVGDFIDDLPIGLFHLQHFFRQTYCWICISVTEELTPYVFPALRQHFSLDDLGLSYFAMSFQFGAALGVLMSAALLDQFGRRRMIVISSPLLVLSCCLMLFAPSYPLILVCRTMVSLFAYTVANAHSPWFAEFLPTRGRGAFLAAISFGWPAGRSLIILIANFYNDRYHPVIFFALVVLLSLAATTATCLESPRFLVVKGDHDGALAVLKRMYQINGTPFDDTIRLQTTSSQTRTSLRSTSQRLRMLFSPRLRPVFAFAVSIITLLACSSILIDTWGPSVYARLLSPDTPPAEAQLPHQVLLLYSLADVVGIAVSVFLTDLVGRQWIMYIGFFGQGIFMALMAPFHNHRNLLLTMGFIGTAGRCFAWEGSMMWTLEAFPTEVRATAYSSAQAFMRFAAVISIHVSGMYVDAISARSMVLTFAAPLLVGGIITMFTPSETANVALSDHVASDQVQ